MCPGARCWPSGFHTDLGTLVHIRKVIPGAA